MKRLLPLAVLGSVACGAGASGKRTKAPEALDPALERSPVTITGAYAVVAASTATLGGNVEPDRFVVKVQAREPVKTDAPPDKWPKVDFFVAKITVGTDEDPGKYGSKSMRLVRSTPGEVKAFPGHPLGEMAVFEAESAALTLACHDGKLQWEAAGDASDELVFRIATQTMVSDVEVWQGGSPNPGAGEDFDDRSARALAYECG